MNTPTISGDALNGSRLDTIRERVNNSTRDALYAPVYGDRRYLLRLVDEMADALRSAVLLLDPFPTGTPSAESAKLARDKAIAALAKVTA